MRLANLARKQQSPLLVVGRNCPTFNDRIEYNSRGYHCGHELAVAGKIELHEQCCSDMKRIDFNQIAAIGFLIGVGVLVMYLMLIAVPYFQEYLEGTILFGN